MVAQIPFPKIEWPGGAIIVIILVPEYALNNVKVDPILSFIVSSGNGKTTAVIVVVVINTFSFVPNCK